MEKLAKDINQILADWDPISVGAKIAKEEYKRYIPLILRTANDPKTLKECLESILIQKLQVGYDSQNERHSRDLENVCKKIIEAYRKERP